mmetsp:Transcript_24770/g.77941  ORF Transcript_24770/g.77941 Transcript_24770/m.77941 type:complete len:239 (+) Transcript_24770:450-1166(+)
MARVGSQVLNASFSSLELIPDKDEDCQASLSLRGLPACCSTSWCSFLVACSKQWTHWRTAYRRALAMLGVQCLTPWSDPLAANVPVVPLAYASAGRRGNGMLDAAGPKAWLLAPWSSIACYPTCLLRVPGPWWMRWPRNPHQPLLASSVPVRWDLQDQGPWQRRLPRQPCVVRVGVSLTVSAPVAWAPWHAMLSQLVTLSANAARHTAHAPRSRGDDEFRCPAQRHSVQLHLRNHLRL